MVKKSKSRVYEPTQDDISKACERIQKNWSYYEEMKRRGYQNREIHWEVPIINLSSYNEVLTESIEDTLK